MDDDEIEEILKEIIDLADLLGWSSAMAQSKDNAILGLYIGDPKWIKSKTGTSTTVH